MASGFIYVMRSDAFREGVFKVGYSADPVRRAVELRTTGSPVRFTIIASYPVSDMEAAEKAAHGALSPWRMEADREFFEVPLGQLLQHVEAAILPWDARAQVAAQRVALEEEKRRQEEAARQQEKERRATNAREFEDAITFVEGFAASNRLKALRGYSCLNPERLRPRWNQEPIHPVDQQCSYCHLSRVVVSEERGASVFDISRASSGDIRIEVGYSLRRAWPYGGHRKYFRTAADLETWLQSDLLPILSDARRDPEYRKSQGLDLAAAVALRSPVRGTSSQTAGRGKSSQGFWLLLALLTWLAIWYALSR